MTENFKRVLVALGCYILFVFMGVTSPAQPKEYLERGILAAIALVVLREVVWRGTWVEKITAAIFGVPAAWELFLFSELLHGNPFLADA
jgi:hypothetical protein